MAVDFDKWALIVATQLRKTDWELPAGVAFHFRAGEQMLVQTHFVNVGSLETKGEGKVLMNLNDADPGTITRPRRRAVRPGPRRLRSAAEQHDRVGRVRVPQGTSN